MLYSQLFSYFALSNLTLIFQIIKQLKKRNPKVNESNLYTTKNIIFGYIALTAGYSGIIYSYARASFFFNIPRTFPNWFLNKYFPHSIDDNVTKTNEFDSKLLFRRISLFTIWALHHSIFARLSVKQWLFDHNIISPRIERSVYVHISNILFYLLIRNWNPSTPSISDYIKNYSDNAYIYKMPFLCNKPWLIQYLPSIIVAILSGYSNGYLSSGEDTVGITQAFDVNYNDKNVNLEKEHIELCTSGVYSMVRHPEMFFNALGVLIAPKMSISGLTWSVLAAIYIIIAIQFEERDLIKIFGKQYIEYSKQVPQLIPSWPIFKKVHIDK